MFARIIILVIWVMFSLKLSSQITGVDYFQKKYDNLFKKKLFDSTLCLSNDFLSWVTKNNTDTSYLYPQVYFLKANCYEELASKDSALHYFRLGFNFYKEKNIKKDEFYVRNVYRLGLLCRETGDFKNAGTYLKIAFDSSKVFKETNGQFLINAAGSLGSFYKNNGEYKKSRLLMEEVLQLKKTNLKDTTLDYISIQNNLANLYVSIREFQLAEPLLREVMNIYKSRHGENHISYAWSLHNYGNYLSERKKDSDSAEIYFLKALQLKRKILGDNDPDCAKTLNSLGSWYLKRYDIDKARINIMESVDIRKKYFGEKHPEYLTSISNAANFYYTICDYKKAEKYSQQMIELNDQSGNLKAKAFNLNFLGAIYRKTGEYKKALEYFEHARSIYLKYNVSSLDFASNTDEIANFYKNIGDFKSSEKYFLEEMNIIKENLGIETEAYAACLNNFGLLYFELKDYQKSQKYFEESLLVKSKIFGDKHFKISSTVHNLGKILCEAGDYSGAENQFINSISILEQSVGKEHPNYGIFLSSLANLKFKMKEYTVAEEYLSILLQSKYSAKDIKSPFYLDIENTLAKIYLKTNRQKEALEIFGRNYTFTTNKIIENFEWLNDNQREAYWKRESSFFNDLFSLSSKIVELYPESAALSYNAVLFIKSKLLEVKISSENYFLELEELRKELQIRRRLQAKLESENDNDNAKIDKIRNEADSLDKLLLVSWPEYSKQRKNLNIKWSDVQDSLDNEEVAIEFIRFKDFDDSLYHYSVLLLKKNMDLPLQIYLCEESELKATAGNIDLGNIYNKIWEPMEPFLKDIHKIYYSPAGLLNNVPFHALYKNVIRNSVDSIKLQDSKRGNKNTHLSNKYEKNTELLIDRFSLHQLISTRSLALGIKGAMKKSLDKNISLVGGVNYDYLPGKVTYHKDTKSDVSRNLNEIPKMNFLEGTKTEIEKINTTLQQHNWQTEKFEYNSATEENIVKLEANEAKNILHLATHGYAFPEYNYKDSSISKNSLSYSYRFSQNPMVRSGLILAGGNWAWTGSDTLSKLGMEQNGILTALEVSQLNLRKTKLVVLSACETGLGKIEGSEGTFGLKRGFKLAGVEQIIVSLWSVPDKETMELMTLFYNDLSLTLNPVISFEKAQKEMRKKYPTDPEKWAGFVLVR